MPPRNVFPFPFRANVPLMLSPGVRPRKAAASPVSRAHADRSSGLTNMFVLKAMRGDCEAVRADAARGQDVDAMHSVRVTRAP